MTAEAQKPLRLTAHEFVTAIAVMSGAAKVNKKPSKPKLVVLEDKVIPGKFRWVAGRIANFTRIVGANLLFIEGKKSPLSRAKIAFSSVKSMPALAKQIEFLPSRVFAHRMFASAPLPG